LPVQALYDPTTLAFITFIGPAGLPFTSAAGGVSSVNVSGGTTGLTTTGGPIVSSGTITIGGTLAVTNGGTGATTNAGALNNLLPTQTGNSGKYLTTDGTNASWATSGGGLTIALDTTTNASRYLTFTSATSGVVSTENVSTSLYFNPSSGSLTATTFVGALTGNATTATSATTSTNLAGGAGGSIPYQTGSGATTFLAAGTNGQYLTLSGGVPTWANITTVSSFSGGTTGLTPNTATTGAITLAGTLAVANGGTGVTTSSGASSVVLRDANVNTSANDFYEGFTNVAAAGTTTTLTAASTPNFVVTGSGGQTYKLPDATTLPTGAIYTFNNNQTSGAITVQNNSSTTIVSVPSGGFVEIILLTNSVAAGTWDYHFQAPANVSWSTNTLSYAGSITNATWNGNVIGAIYGGTGQTSYITGDTLYASASNTLSKLGIGSSGQVLTVVSGVPAWANTTVATTITDDTTTNATRYINFTSATSGTLSTIYTSSTKLQYNPSTGAFTAPTLTPTNALGISYGGTGQTTASAAFNALSPITTTGDLIIGNGTNSATRLAIGTNGYVLTSNGTTASWQAATGTSATYTRTSFTATASQTTFSVTYTVGYIQVYLNGVLLNASDYTASSGTSIVLAVGANSGDILETIAYNVVSLGTATSSTNIAGGSAGEVVYQSGSGATSFTAVGTTGQVLTSNGTSAPTWSTLSYPSLSSAQTWTATQTFNGSSSTFSAVMLNVAETVNVVGSAPSSTTNFYVQSGSVQYYTTNAANNWTLNIAFSSGTSLNSAMSTGQSMTIAMLSTQGSTAYYNSAVTIDGTSVTPYWQGGSAPTKGNASGIDVYTYTVIKTGSATYTVLASQTQF